MKIIKIAIVGGRDFMNRGMLYDKMNWVEEQLRRRHLDVVIEVLDGGALGADELGGEWGRSKGYTVHDYPADWKRYGKRAGFMRNSCAGGTWM